MVKKDRLSIIDAIEKASEAELGELAKISQALQNLAPANERGPVDGESNGSALVVSRRLKQRTNVPGPKNSRPPQAEKADTKSPQTAKKEQKRTYERDFSEGSESGGGKVRIERTKKAGNGAREGSERRTYADVLTANGQKLTRERGPKPSSERRHQQARETRPSEESNNSTNRDASGRFVSRDKAEETSRVRQQKLGLKEQEKLQGGFFNRLGSMLKGSSEKDSKLNADGAELVGGAAVGGPVWMLGRGMFDLGKSVSDNVVSLQQWVSDKKEGKELSEPTPAKKYPDVVTQPLPPPKMGSKSSAETFSKGAQEKGIQATQEQTQVIAANDERIIEGLDEIREEIKRSGKGAAGGGLGGWFGDRFGRKGRRGRLGHIGRGDVSLPEKARKKVRKPRNGSLGKLKAVMTSANVLKGAGGVAAGGALVATGAKVATDVVAKPAAEKVTTKAVEAAAKPASEKVATKAVEAATKPVAAKVVAPIAEEAGEAAAKTGALKAGGKLGAKTALKAIPLLGTALSIGWDAYDGATDEEGQRAAFNVAEGKEVSARQKTAFTAANVLNMGGLVSGGAGLLASGARMFGMDSVADALTFDTESIAKGLDSGMATVGDAISKVTSSYEDKGNEITKAVSDGTDKTVNAINRLGTQMQGGEWGKDNVGAEGKSVSDYESVKTNDIGADLNIGGKNAKVRSFRNNNFGNLNYVGQEGARLEDPNSKGEARFAKFNTPEEGFRALAHQLTLYSNGKSKATGGKKLNSVEDIIKVYAPESENSTKDYISALSKKMGVESGQQLDMTNPDVMTQLIRGIATIEGGNPQVTDQFIKDSIGTHENGKWVGGKFSNESLKVVNEARVSKGMAPVAENSLYSTGSKVITTAPKGVVSPSPASAPIATPAAVADIPAKVDKVVQEQLNEHGVRGMAKNRPEEGVSQPKSAIKSSEEVAKAIAEKAASGSASIWDKTKSAAATGASAVIAAPGKLDAALQEKMTEYNVRGMAKNRPSAGLSLPAGATMPSSLEVAALPAAEISRRGRDAANRQNTQATTIVSASGRPAAGAAPGATSGIPRVTARDAAVPEESMFEKAMGGAVDGLKAVGASILPAVSDTLNQTISGFSGNQIVGDALNAAGMSDPTIQRAIAPVTDKVGTWLDSGMSSLTDASTSLLTKDQTAQPAFVPQQSSSLSIPKSMPTVQDLASSGIRPSLSTDTANHDVDILKELRGMGSTLEQLLGVSKQKDGAPEKVVHTAQPAPRRAASFSIRDAALDGLLKD
ncbi:hypothetical protein M2J86_24725 (plasmid) [Citrobacter freundii]|uniref:hypothetical protein n=1 Tax=Citrobacter TaxID=544 RepID=UPI0018D09FFC|nr:MULTISPECIES: hypothetical protein [Citrobacter]EET7319690.1 hypothetical protein [Escherichia coli]DAW18591.1 MAG TPA: virion protein [Caudoviricetes sp.]ELE2066197.1 hypothetical protein [Citrobacter freundii]MBJ8798680.1 hypothetical protein [Citrobacter freundii]MDE9576027.1 hypothetical protein [Citrobacter portucalensis]